MSQLDSLRRPEDPDRGQNWIQIQTRTWRQAWMCRLTESLIVTHTITALGTRPEGPWPSAQTGKTTCMQSAHYPLRTGYWLLPAGHWMISASHRSRRGG